MAITADCESADIGSIPISYPIQKWRHIMQTLLRTAGQVNVWGDPIDEGALSQIFTALEHPQAVTANLMADHHKGYAVPIGGVVAYDSAISPSGVGYDIACGNKAVRLDIPADEVRGNIDRIMDMIAENISFGVGRKDGRAIDDSVFEKPEWQTLPMMKSLKDAARYQLGTVGGGNHYVDVFVDELEQVWVGVHFGSRGLGHKTATWFLNEGGAKDGMDVEPLVLGTNTELGDMYLQAMTLAGNYAYAGRDFVCRTIAQLLGANILEEVHNHHNFAWNENHYGMDLWVVRKGATPAFPGQVSFVGGSMGDMSYILQGIDSLESKQALYSTVHGAGRVMSRTAAKGKYNRKTGEMIAPGAISPADMAKWLEEVGVVLRGGDLDEAPQAYKRIIDVLSRHSNTIRILHTLKPLGVVMAGKDVVDPFKD
jgi:tRNA-splicing ligase RtcB